MKAKNQNSKSTNSLDNSDFHLLFKFSTLVCLEIANLFPSVKYLHRDFYHFKSYSDT